MTAAGGKVVLPAAYSLKATMASSNVKNNWQRSITTITKYPPSNKSSTHHNSGKKTATTKLNYGFHILPPNIAQQQRGVDETINTTAVMNAT